MTIEELWQNLKPLVDNIETKVNKLQPLVGEVSELKTKVNRLEPLIGEVSELKAKVDKLEPLVGEVSELKAKVSKLEPLVGKVDSLEIKVNKLEPLVDEVHEMKKELHRYGTTNMTILINQQTEFSKQLKQTNEKLDKYLQKNEVDHKKFEYEIAELEWKTKMVR